MTGLKIVNDCEFSLLGLIVGFAMGEFRCKWIDFKRKHDRKN